MTGLLVPALSILADVFRASPATVQFAIVAFAVGQLVFGPLQDRLLQPALLGRPDDRQAARPGALHRLRLERIREMTPLPALRRTLLSRLGNLQGAPAQAGRDQWLGGIP
ncbi:MAG: hypothetical protein ACE37J_16525 [Pikeienuella sp.]|uniref:hypothetical protein n=1 Tax=Pikeienuella sp. TaxID=2831957 RepID=UPI00391AB7FE